VGKRGAERNREAREEPVGRIESTATNERERKIEKEKKEKKKKKRKK
jgi:hypothetical protein